MSGPEIGTPLPVDAVSPSARLYTEQYSLGQIKEAKVVERQVEHLKHLEKRVEGLLIKLERDRNSAVLTHEIGMIYLDGQVDDLALQGLGLAVRSEDSASRLNFFTTGAAP
jgi:hypothetical protein